MLLSAGDAAGANRCAERSFFLRVPDGGLPAAGTAAIIVTADAGRSAELHCFATAGAEDWRVLLG